jgi:hypothetical protein
MPNYKKRVAPSAISKMSKARVQQMECDTLVWNIATNNISSFEKHIQTTSAVSKSTYLVVVVKSLHL